MNATASSMATVKSLEAVASVRALPVNTTPYPGFIFSSETFSRTRANAFAQGNPVQAGIDGDLPLAVESLDIGGAVAHASVARRRSRGPLRDR